MHIEQARRAIDEAIESLLIEMYKEDGVTRIKGPESTIAIELDRVDSAIGPKGQSMFASLAEDIRQCTIALYEAKNALC